MFILPFESQPIHSQQVENQKTAISRNYEYNVLSFKNSASDAYSVVTNTDKTRVFAYMAPRQTQTVEDFKQDYVQGQQVEIVEALEGTMITFFFNSEIGEWDICTRNGVGGNYSYLQQVKPIYSEQGWGDYNNLPNLSKTFLQKTLDVFRLDLFVREQKSPDQTKDLSDVEALKTLSPDYCYTCILQHPDNHIVYEIGRFNDRLYLVSIYKIEQAESVTIEVKETTEITDPEVWESAGKIFYAKCQTVDKVDTTDALLSSKPFNHVSDQEPLPSITSQALNHPYSAFRPPSWILVNKATGQRTEVPNAHYQRAKELRNMQPNLRYMWLQVSRKGDLIRYLSAFPQYRTWFERFQLEYDRFVSQVYNAYVSFYILKHRDGAIPKKYFVHAAKIHHYMYLPSVASGQKRNIRLTAVFDYFDKFTASQMFYFLTKPETDEIVTNESSEQTQSPGQEQI